MRRAGSWLVTIALWTAPASFALGPHEIIVVANWNSPRSLEVANHFVHLRKIPPSNIVLVSPPDSVLAANAEISPADFTDYIWAPVNAEVARRGLADHMLAWVYSVDLPVRVMTEPPVSLHGLTFARNQLPAADEIVKGTYRSPLFCGPDKADGPVAGSSSLEHFAARYGNKLPLPAMSLGFAGARGLTPEQIVAGLKYGMISDGSAPDGKVFLVMSADVRSECRAWQFPAAQREILDAHVYCTISSNAPQGEKGIVGLMMGAPAVSPSGYGAYRPGALAENLTSFGAYFTEISQSKVTDWLRAGAAASSGAVWEPFALWSKFPNARLFAHYAHGLTALESFYSSIRCPLQLLVVGDPLAQPWARPLPLTLVSLAEDADAVTGTVSFLATTFADPAQLQPEYLFLVDDRSVNHPGSQPELPVNTSLLTDGYHSLRAVAYARGDVRYQSFSALGFQVRNRGRGIRLQGPPPKAEVDLFHPLRLTVQADGEPKDVAIIARERILAQMPYVPNAEFFVDLKELGLGPNTIQAVALYEGPEAVRSAPLSINVKKLNGAPVIESVEETPDVAGGVLLSTRVSDPEGDVVRVEWLQALDHDDLSLPDDGVWEGGGFLFETESAGAIATLDGVDASSIAEFSADVSAPNSGYQEKAEWAGLAFNVTDKNNFDFFGLFGDQSAWIFGRMVTGVLERVLTRGTPIENGRSFRVAIRPAGERGVEAHVDGELLCRWPDQKWTDAPVGLAGGHRKAQWKNVCVSPPQIPAGAFSVTNASLRVPDADHLKGTEISARASDGFYTTEQTVAVRATAPPRQ